MADTFSFSSSGLASDIFRVLRFSGTESVSECYSFELELLALKEFDVKSLYDADAVFSVSRHDGTSTAYQGRVASIGVERMMDGDFFKCRARLVPHLWFYTLRKSSKAYVGKSISEIIDTELKENGEGASGGFMSRFDQLPQNSFPLVVKYHETPLEFVSRLLQRECLYYYFLSEDGMDTLKFSSDAKLSSNEVLTAKVINNLTFSSLGEQDERILFKSVHMEQARRSEVLNLYTYDGNPDSVQSMYGVGRTAIEKNMLGPLRDISNIRQAQDVQPAVRYNMATSVRGARVGIVHDGLRALSLRHDGDQSAAVLESLGLPTEAGQKDFYRNQGLWMPEGDPYIPQWNLEAPRIANATLTGFTTRINANGTYNVKCHSIDAETDLPNVRMVFPFAGKKGEASGMHLPLVDGTEVLLEFLEGDPDRPVIMGSLYNTSVSTPVTAANNAEHILYTPQDNRICLVDGDEDKIVIEAQKRIEAFSNSELLEIDSTGNYIRGSATNKIALHAGASDSPNESGDNGTGGTSLVLNGTNKKSCLQVADDVYMTLNQSSDRIIIDATGTKIAINELSADDIYLKTKILTYGYVSGSLNQIEFKALGGPQLTIYGGDDKVEIATNGGPKIILEASGDKATIKTNAGPFCEIDGENNLINLMGDANNYIKIDAKAGKVTTYAKETNKKIFGISYTKTDGLENAFHLGGKNDITVGEKTSTNIGAKITTNALQNGTFNLGLTTDIEMSGGLSLVFSSKKKFILKDDTVEYKRKNKKWKEQNILELDKVLARKIDHKSYTHTQKGIELIQKFARVTIL